MKLRLANINDTEGILNVYKPYVENTTITFEYDVPSLEEFKNRILTISKNFPYIVCEVDDTIVGYAYASKYHGRSAFAWTVELSIYVNENYHNHKISHKLYSSLLDILKIQGVYNAYSCITIPNEKSKKFHERFGFNLVGTFSNSGYKFGKWIDVMWMEKNLIDYNLPPKEITPINLIENYIIEDIFNKYI